MHGARRAAFEFIQKYLGDNRRVLDLCCGSNPWLRQHVLDAGCSWVGVDHVGSASKIGGFIRADLGIQNQVVFCEPFDLVVTCYGMQHLQDYEAFAWQQAHQWMHDTSLFIYIGNYNYFSYRNLQRNDPANVHNYESLNGLALATGFQIQAATAFAYEADPSDKYEITAQLSGECPEGCRKANGFFALLRKRG